MQNLYDFISSIAQKNPDKIAVLRCDITGKTEENISYKELQEKIRNASLWLINQYLKPSDSLALAISNSPEFLILSWAAWSIGMVTVPLDLKRGTLEEHVYKIKVSNAKIVISQRGVFSENEKKKFGKTKVKEFHSLNNDSKKQNIPWVENFSATALILFTSGTTAHPKAAELSL